jgi:distribution and morphology protein 31
MNSNVALAIAAAVRRSVGELGLAAQGAPLWRAGAAWGASRGGTHSVRRPIGPSACSWGGSPNSTQPHVGSASALLLRHPPPRLANAPQPIASAAAAAYHRNARFISNTSKRNDRATGPRDESLVDSSPKQKNRQPTAPAPQANLSPQPDAPPEPPSAPKEQPKAETHHSAESSKYFSLPQALPHLKRPTKAELLEAASGFWSRIRVHFKWLAIRSNRPFNADEIYALFSWILAAHFAWLLLGTTTFIMLTVFMINTVFAQESVAQWIGNYLTKSSGIKVIFESAVVPKWKDGVISFRKVFVSRRPGQKNTQVTKGSQSSAAAAAAALAHKERGGADAAEEEEDTNYTQFDISIDTVNVTLSFSRWMNGKGILKDVEIKGIRGVVDRTSVHAIEGVDPRSYKHTHQPGDFELESFKMEDLLVTIYQPNNFRPFSVSIYSCDLPQLRKQWLFYDFLSANMMSGSFDNSLFTIHPRQTHNYTGAQLSDGRDTDDGSTWKKQTRIRIDGLNIDHLNRGYEGPFSWIYEGNVDIVSDIMLPNDDDDSLAKVMSDMYDRVEATVTQNHDRHYSDHAAHGFDEHHHQPGPYAKESIGEASEDDKRFVIMDVRVHLNDVRAAVPLFTKDISYVNNALVRPIVAYINTRKTFIPVNCRVVKRASEFDGSWTLYDSGLMEDMSREVCILFSLSRLFLYGSELTIADVRCVCPRHHRRQHCAQTPHKEGRHLDAAACRAGAVSGASGEHRVSPVVHTENTIYPELRSSVHACKIAMAFVRLGLNGRSIMTGMGWVVWERSVQLYSIHVIDIMTTGSGKHAEPSRAGLDESIALSLLIWYGAIISL